MSSKESIWLKAMKLGKMCGCHQLPDRSFFIRNYQFPICARCTGVMIGYIFSLIHRQEDIFINGLFMVIMLVDWLVQFFKIKSSTNLRRLLTGILGGYGLMNVYVLLIIKLSLIINVKINWIILIFGIVFVLRYVFTKQTRF